MRRFDVAMSVDALASAWARQEAAPSGSVVWAANEISGRLRGGVPWTVRDPDGMMMAMVVRPNLDPRHEALLWLPVTLAAAQAIEAVTGREALPLWPDSVGPVGGDPLCSTNVVVQLGPGRIDYALLIVRADLTLARVSDADALLAALIEGLIGHVAALEAAPLNAIEAFSDAYPLMGQTVKATLLPRGAAWGRIAAIDPDGDLVLETTTGMLERIMPANLRSLEQV